MGLKVAIIGYTDHRAQAPLKDPEWEKWGLNDLYFELPDGIPPEQLRWFQLHPWAEIAHHKEQKVTEDPLNFSGGPPHGRDPNHVPWLTEAATHMKLYMFTKRPEVPDALLYPKEQAYKYFSLDGKKPNRYFTNTISWMIALAIMEGAEEIGIYGVDMMMDGGEGSEYGWQRPSCEFFIGWARGAGIKVHIPDESDLLKTAFVYGDEAGEAFRKKLKAIDGMYAGRLNEAQGMQHQANQAKWELTGARNTLAWVMRSWMPGDGDPTKGRAPVPGSHKELTRLVAASDGDG